MTALVVAVAVAAGIACSEFMVRTLHAGSWLRARARRVRDLLDGLRSADNDDERQRAMIRAGGSMLLVSLSFLAWIAAIAAILLVPGVTIGSDVPFSILYMVVASVAALAWWALRFRHAR